MNTIRLSIILIAIFTTHVLISGELPHKQEFLDDKEYKQLRLGMLSSSGNYKITSETGTNFSNLDIKDGSAFEASYVWGITKQHGYDYRGAFTLDYGEETLGELKTSYIMFLLEGEFAYNYNDYFSPFTGWYGGVGLTDIQDFPDQQSLKTYDVGIFVGISGEIYKNLGYIAKYSYGWKGFNDDPDIIGFRLNPTKIRLGVTYTF